MSNINEDRVKHLVKMIDKYGSGFPSQKILLFSRRQMVNESFDAGVEAERERVIAAIKKARNPFEFSDLFQELFPDQQEQRSE